MWTGKRKHGPGRDRLQIVEGDVIRLVTNHPAVQSLHGIGSYYRSKRDPGDLDVFIRLRKPFMSTDARQLAYDIYSLQDKHRDGDGSLLNAFVQDPDGGVLDVCDLWWVYEKGEDLQENIKERRHDFGSYIPSWRRAKTIISNSAGPVTKKIRYAVGRRGKTGKPEAVSIGKANQ